MGFTNTANFGQKSAFVEKRILDLELLGLKPLPFRSTWIFENTAWISAGRSAFPTTSHPKQ